MEQMHIIFRHHTLPNKKNLSQKLGKQTLNIITKLDKQNINFSSFMNINTLCNFDN